MMVHGVAMLAVWLSAVTLSWKIGFTLVLTGSGVFYFFQLSRLSFTVIEADQSGYYLWYQGQKLDARLKQAFVTAPLTVMQFQLASSQQVAITLLMDSTDPDAYRHLRVWLRWVKYDKNKQL